MLSNRPQSIDVFELKSYMIEETSTTPFAGISVIDSSFLLQGHVFLSLKMATFRSQVEDLLISFYRRGNQLKKIRIDLEIMETGSVGWMYQVLALIWNNRRTSDEMEIIWYYDRSRMDGLQEGKKISERSGIPMTFISKD
ncbi:SiaC family regulatory phosphoprotein [Reichenbachiella sp.]|uniref:SiaC family regulatory phosphoprotein n=1 Tax=Reichenbachiella sp. TaxID=2184521 RepID=UPI003B59C6F9